MAIEFSRLKSGLRVLTDPVPSVESVAVGVWVDAGTRHEDMAHNGIAHMVEHMMFKGTPTRTALQIAEQIEDVGGQMNAYTSREITSYHMHLLKEDLRLALEVLADIVQRPTMPPEEIERERGVILQEIGMTLDTPDDIIFDNYQETAYPGQALGAPILGRAEIIQAIQGDALQDYVRRFYTPGRIVVAVSGNAAHAEVVKMCEDLFGDLPPDTAFAPPGASYQGGIHRHDKTLEQSHIVLGFEGIARTEDDYFAASVLATILGGGMSSRLFQEVREKRGLVYSVFASHSAYQDSGQFVLYAGTGPEKIPELIPVLCDEIRKACAPAGEGELNRAKAQLRAEMLMGRESMMRRANQQAKHMIHFNGVIDLDERLAQLAAVDAAAVAAAARRIFSGIPTLAALGPLGSLEPYDRLCERLAA